MRRLELKIPVKGNLNFRINLELIEFHFRYIYSLKHQNSSNEPKQITCISCHVNASCLYNSAIFSPDSRHFIMECLGPSVPIYYLVNTDTETVVEVLDRSDPLQEWVRKRMIPKVRHYTVGHIRIQLAIPADVNEYDDARYPLVIETGRLPGTQKVNFVNKLDWLKYLTSRKEYITARIDTRGSNFQGDRFQYSIYKKIGDNELEDFRVAIAYLKQLSFIDSSKIAVWGREYGGYMAVALLAKEDLIACSVAVSPISSWKNYCNPSKSGVVL